MIILASALFLTATSATLPTTSAAELSDDAISERLEFLQQRLDDREAPARAWLSGWTTYYAVMFGGNLGAGFWATKVPQLRGTFIIIGSAAGVGLLGTLILPPPSAFAAARLRRIGEESRGARLDKLIEGERLLKTSASIERLRSSWIASASGFVVSATAGLVIWLAFHSPVVGLIDLIAGVAISQLQIWTVTDQTDRDWQEYQRRFGLVAPPAHTAWAFTVTPGGLGFTF